MGTWVAQSVKYPTSAQVMISGLWVELRIRREGICLPHPKCTALLLPRHTLGSFYAQPFIFLLVHLQGILWLYAGSIFQSFHLTFLIKDKYRQELFSIVICGYASISFLMSLSALQIFLYFSSFYKGDIHIFCDCSFSPTCVFSINSLELKPRYGLQSTWDFSGHFQFGSL